MDLVVSTARFLLMMSPVLANAAVTRQEWSEDHAHTRLPPNHRCHDDGSVAELRVKTSSGATKRKPMGDTQPDHSGVDEGRDLGPHLHGNALSPSAQEMIIFSRIQGGTGEVGGWV